MLSASILAPMKQLPWLACVLKCAPAPAAHLCVSVVGQSDSENCRPVQVPASKQAKHGALQSVVALPWLHGMQGCPPYGSIQAVPDNKLPFVLVPSTFPQATLDLQRAAFITSAAPNNSY